MRDVITVAHLTLVEARRRRIVLAGPTLPTGALFGPPYLTDDGLHPNRRGSRLVAAALAKALNDPP